MARKIRPDRRNHHSHHRSHDSISQWQNIATDGRSILLAWKSLIAIAIGILVAYLGGRGALLMGSQPTVVAGLLIGTVLGVALFKGVPVGPLIAAGILSLLIGRG